MPGDVDHFLLTRFSAVLDPAGAPPTEEWLRYRLGFFYDATYPSVRSQTSRDFTWLVLLDDRCSDAFREDVEELAEGVFEPVWSHEPFRRDSFVAPILARTEGSPAGHLITTRLDSDDALAVDFMASVRAQFAQQDLLFVNFTRGVQIERSGAVLRSDQVSSPFLSLIERRRPDAPPMTVYVAKHARARAHGPVREVRAPVMWAQVIHDLNLSNIANGGRVDPRVLAERFDLTLPYAADLSAAELATGRLRQAGRLARLWSAHPGELTKWVEAKGEALRATRDLPQSDGRSLSDRVQDTERRVRGVGRRVKGDLTDARWSWTGRVNARAPQALRVVSGDLDRLQGADRLVVLAEYSRGTRIRPEALAAATAYADAGCAVLVVAARDAWSRGVVLDQPQLPDGVVVATRSNVGYDFGSWAAALGTWPELATIPTVILTNDSLMGPFGPLDDLVARIEDADADVWAATANRSGRWHLQTYLVAFRHGALASPGLAEFLASVRPLASKRAVVDTYERGLTDAAGAAGLRVHVEWPQADLRIPEGADPVLDGAVPLLEQGFPFAKRMIFTASHVAGHREPVAAAVRRIYGRELSA